MNTVFVTRGGRRWHANAACMALESGRMLWDSDESWPYPIREVGADSAVAAKRTPCRRCAPAAAPTA